MRPNLPYHILLAYLMPGGFIAFSFLGAFCTHSSGLCDLTSTLFVAEFIAFSILVGFHVDMVGHVLWDRGLLARCWRGEKKQRHYFSGNFSGSGIIHTLEVELCKAEGEPILRSFIEDVATRSEITITDRDRAHVALVDGIFYGMATAQQAGRVSWMFSFYEAGRNMITAFILSGIGFRFSPAYSSCEHGTRCQTVDLASINHFWDWYLGITVVASIVILIYAHQIIYRIHRYRARVVLGYLVNQKLTRVTVQAPPQSERRGWFHLRA